MVAFTNSQLLPYQVGTDRPCDSPEVWCDFVDLVDSKLSATGQILDRLTPAIPAAKLIRAASYLPATTFEPVAFDTVDFDTDNMVDFNRSVFDIRPRRTGTYLATAYVSMSGGGAAGTLVCSFIGVGDFNSFIRTDCLRNPGGGTFYLRVTTPIQWTGVNFFSGEPLPSGILLTVNPNATPFIILRAELAVYWVNDRTT